MTLLISAIVYIIAFLVITYLSIKYSKFLQKRIGSRKLKKTLLPLIRELMPTVIAHDLVGVQPMSKSSAEIFTLRPVYGVPQQMEFDFTPREPEQLVFDFYNEKFPIQYVPRDEDYELALKYNVQSDPDGGIMAALKRVPKDLPNN